MEIMEIIDKKIHTALYKVKTDDKLTLKNMIDLAYHFHQNGL